MLALEGVVEERRQFVGPAYFEGVYFEVIDVSGVDARYVVLEEGKGHIGSGTQVEVAAVGVVEGAVFDFEFYVIEGDVVDNAFGAAEEDDAAFAVGGDVREGNIIDLAEFFAGVETADGGDVDWLCVAPPVSGVQACFDGDIREGDVFDGAGAPDVDEQASVGFVNDEIFEGAVFDIAAGIADADAC